MQKKSFQNTHIKLIGYRIVRAGAPEKAETHIITSWDAGVVTNRVKNGSEVSLTSWNVYDGELIPLQSGDALHVNAMRIGYKPAIISYINGKIMPQQPLAKTDK